MEYGKKRPNGEGKPSQEGASRLRNARGSLILKAIELQRTLNSISDPSSPDAGSTQLATNQQGISRAIGYLQFKIDRINKKLRG
jgi:hypothetical protein